MRPEYQPGARNAVRTCLNIHAGDRVAVVEDRQRAEIAEAIKEEVEGAGADLFSWVMEDLVERPARSFPRDLADAIRGVRPTASYYIGGGMPGELAFRQPMLHLLADELRCRHGHMIGIDGRLMVDGMAADYEEVYRVTRQVFEIVRQATRIDVATRLGTELSATFSAQRRWIPCDGRYWEQGRWGNLPEGETFTAPLGVDGVIAAEEAGDYFSEKYGMLRPPMRIVVKDGRVVKVEAEGRPELQADFEAYLGQHTESNRAGEFAIGTNVGLTEIVGNFLQDEKFPGVHVAFGDPYGFETGADWACPTHVDVLASHANVWVDGRQVMEDGRFLV
jgi:leucyl aminopeptidase (aminopeptidase T)